MVVWVKHQANWAYNFNSVEGMVGDHISGLGVTLVRRARVQAGKSSFALVRSMHSDLGVRGGEVEAQVGSPLSYALMHHEGTNAHWIAARHSKALRFQQRGIVRYASRVWHPGTAPNKYLTDNLPKVING